MRKYKDLNPVDSEDPSIDRHGIVALLPEASIPMDFNITCSPGIWLISVLTKPIAVEPVRIHERLPIRVI